MTEIHDPAHAHDHAQAHEHEHDQAMDDWPAARYGHLRADVHKRRAGYRWILAFGLATLAVSAIDILVLSQKLFIPVVATYGALALLAVMLFMSRPIKQPADEPAEADAQPAGEAVASLHERVGQSYDRADLHQGVLSCPGCRNLFQLGLEHFDQRRPVLFTCPECGDAARLPTAAKTPVEAELPKLPVHDARYHCDHCGEDWSVGTFGHEGRISRFDSCPHCGVEDQILVRRTVNA